MDVCVCVSTHSILMRTEDEGCPLWICLAKNALVSPGTEVIRPFTVSKTAIDLWSLSDWSFPPQS